MDATIVDYSLTAAILSWLAKNGYDFLKNRGSNGNGKVSLSEIKLALTETKDQGVGSLQTEFRHSLSPLSKQLDELIETSKESNRHLADLVITNRERR